MSGLSVWKRISIARKLHAVIGTMAVLITCELVTLRFAMHTLSAVRAFVAGEGAWSKAQKSAALSLQHYALTGDEASYRAFHEQLRVPEGDRRARVELEKPEYDEAVVLAGFVQGNIAPDDVPGMIDLLRRFHRVSYMARAIDCWRRADEALVEFRAAGVRYHDLLSSGARDAAALSAALARVHQLDGELTRLETEFSNVLGEGSRWMERVVISLLFLAVLTVEAVGLTLTFRISRAISRGLAEANAAAARIGGGDFSSPIPVRSDDELGRLAESINRMGGMLDQSYKGLEGRVRQRTSELETMASENALLYERARAAVESRDEFISIASHELKSPLSALILSLEVLSRQMEKAFADPDERPRIARTVDSALRQGRRLALLSSELSDLTAIRAGGIQIRREPCDLASIVRDVALQFGHDAARAGSALEIVADAPVRGELDPVRMMQVVSNLLSNAIKYGGGKPIRVALRAREGQASLVVQDQGIGIKPESQSRVFERMERAPEVSEKFPGLGLGLYITRQIIERHGGTISLQSEVGSGSTFEVTLPLVDRPAPAA